MRSDNSVLPEFLYSVSQNIDRQLCFILRTSLEGELRQNTAYWKESDQDGEGVENQILKEQLKELVMISLVRQD